jgi:hypothetical protein
MASELESVAEQRWLAEFLRFAKRVSQRNVKRRARWNDKSRYLPPQCRVTHASLDPAFLLFPLVNPVQLVTDDLMISVERCNWA